MYEFFVNINYVYALIFHKQMGYSAIIDNFAL